MYFPIKLSLNRERFLLLINMKLTLTFPKAQYIFFFAQVLSSVTRLKMDEMDCLPHNKDFSYLRKFAIQLTDVG